MKNYAFNRPWLWFAIALALGLCLVFFALGVVVFLLGPHEVEFDTVAVYEAPKSGYRIVIESRGVMRPGRDLSDASSGTATIAPLPGVAGQAIHFTLAGVDGAEFTIEGLASGRIHRGAVEPLAELLGLAGYAVLSREEVSETAAAIDGALAGPKMTVMEGQSKSLRVVSTRFR